MVSTAQLVLALGGKAVFKERTATYDVIVDRVRAGLPYAVLESLATRFELPQERLTRVLRIPVRTLARRKKERRLQAAESDRLLRVARIAAFAEDVLGDAAKAGRWLQKPNRALGGVSPLDQLDTDIGAWHVEQVLGRIAHGVYS
jgi:putative toxin-antitoxin system antitoxin component (TIGR02293 family)